MRFKPTHSSLEQQAIHLLSAILTLNEGSVTMHSHAADRVKRQRSETVTAPLDHVCSYELGSPGAGLGVSLSRKVTSAVRIPTDRNALTAYPTRAGPRNADRSACAVFRPRRPRAESAAAR